MRPTRRSTASRRHAPGSADERGFTLIELLVVITILGILAAIVVFAVQGIGDKGKASASATDASIIRTAEEAYCAKNGTYAKISTLIGQHFLASGSGYSSVALGKDGKCGPLNTLGSSFTVDTGQTGFVPGKSAIDVGNRPEDVAVDSLANRVYVTNVDDGTVSVLDGVSDTVIDTVTVGVMSSQTNGFVEVSALHKAYVMTSAGVAIIDGTDPKNSDGNPATNAVQTVAFAQSSSRRLGVNPANNEVYVTATNSTTVKVISGTSDAVVATVTVPSIGSAKTTNFTFDKTTNMVYTPTASGIEAINGATHVASAVAGGPISLAGIGGPLAIDEAAGAKGKLYFAISGVMTGTVDLADSANNTSHASTDDTDPDAPVTTNWRYVTIDPATGTVFYLANGITPADGTSRVGSFDVATDAFTMIQSTFGQPGGIGLAYSKLIVANPGIGQVYAVQASATPGNPAMGVPGLPGTGGLLVLDETGLLPTVLGAGRQFSSIAVNTTTNKAYAVDMTDGTVAVVQ
jgi:prepilin-type N-terminal cleavage/methylation domain-containing protein